jgi:hypothetical protein
MKTPVLILLISVFTPLCLFSQPESDSMQVRGRLLFAPLIAHHVEPRMGMSRLIGEGRLRLDIGNSIDVLRREQVAGNAIVAVGADFFTWTSLRQETDFHFPVDAVDYLFGLNASYLRPLNAEVTVSARMRFSHISAHLVDGSYQKEQGSWRDDQLPRVYSREYVECIGAIDLHRMLRVYAGGQYIYHIDPAFLGQWTAQIGAEAVWKNAPGCAIHPYIAVDIRYHEITEWSAATQVQLGIKAGEWRGTGINLFLALYHGKSQHGEYFDRTWSYWGPGVNIEF